MKKICYAVLSLAIGFAFSAMAYGQESRNLDDKATRAMLALNYCHMSLVKILAYQDRIILDDEYNNIINNINLSAIEDEEILTILKHLMDTLTEFKLAEGDKDILVKEYDKHVSLAFYTAMQMNPINVLIGKGTDMITETLNIGPTLKSLLSIGGPYEHYRKYIKEYRETLDEKLWKLEKKTIKRINGTRKDFLESYWKLMKKYHIPDEWRLTESQLQRAINIFKETDVEKRLRQLEDIQHHFSVFPPFWYMLARTAQDSDRYEKALAIYEKIEQDRLPFFREDHEFASALMSKVVLLQTLEEQQSEVFAQVEGKIDIPKDLLGITQNSPFDWRKNVFAALQYMKLKDYDAARALVIRNIDNEKEVSANSRILGDIHALSHDEETLADLIRQMYQDDRVKYQDTLYLIGKIRDGKLLRNVLDFSLQPALVEIDFRVARNLLTAWKKDRFVVSIPDIWVKYDPENFTIKVMLADGKKTYSPDKDLEVDKDNNKVNYFFKGIINEEEFLKQQKHETLIVELQDIAQTASLLVDVSVEERRAKENILDKSLDTPKQALDATKKLYKGWFSKDKDAESQKPSSQEEKQEETTKTEKALRFKIREIAISERCYRMNDSMLERVSECSF